MAEEKKFIRIQSTITILVTPGLQLSDYTDEKKNVANKLNIKPRWQSGAIQIKQGAHYYPVEIKNWDSVKALVKSGHFTLGDITTEVPEQFADETKTTAKNFEKGQREMNVDLSQAKKPKKLADIEE